jgi:hypothetical protein
VWHVYSSVEKFMEEKVWARFVPHALMTTEIRMDCIISEPSVNGRG